MAKFIKTDNLGAFEKALAGLVGEQVLVGIPDSTADRKDEGEPLSNAEIGYIQETGSPANNIPARPFLVPGVEAAADSTAEKLGKAAGLALGGLRDQARTAMSAAGLIAQNSVRATINAGIEPALADSTLEARARRGRKGAAAELARRDDGADPSMTGAKPLIDSGQLRNAITYVLRKK